MPSVEVTGSQFTLRGVFGPLLLRANASGGASAWALKTVLLRGHDITDEPTVLTASDSGHLQVVFTSKAPSIEGVVTAENGHPSADATIVVFGHDPKTWTLRSSFTRLAGLDKDGKFAVRGLREGRYYAVAVSSDLMSNVAQPTAEILESLSGVATAFTLNAGESRSVDLRLVQFER